MWCVLWLCTIAHCSYKMCVSASRVYSYAVLVSVSVILNLFVRCDTALGCTAQKEEERKKLNDINVWSGFILLYSGVNWKLKLTIVTIVWCSISMCIEYSLRFAASVECRCRMLNERTLKWKIGYGSINTLNEINMESLSRSIFGVMPIAECILCAHEHYTILNWDFIRRIFSLFFSRANDEIRKCMNGSANRSSPRSIQFDLFCIHLRYQYGVNKWRTKDRWQLLTTTAAATAAVATSTTTAIKTNEISPTSTRLLWKEKLFNDLTRGN